MHHHRTALIANYTELKVSVLVKHFALLLPFLVISRRFHRTPRPGRFPLPLHRGVRTFRHRLGRLNPSYSAIFVSVLLARTATAAIPLLAFAFLYIRGIQFSFTSFFPVLRVAGIFILLFVVVGGLVMVVASPTLRRNERVEIVGLLLGETARLSDHVEVVFHADGARPDGVGERRDVARLRYVLHFHRKELYHARNVPEE